MPRLFFHREAAIPPFLTVRTPKAKTAWQFSLRNNAEYVMEWFLGLNKSGKVPNLRNFGRNIAGKGAGRRLSEPLMPFQMA
jgi:hypothetical protein